MMASTKDSSTISCVLILLLVGALLICSIKFKSSENELAELNVDYAKENVLGKLGDALGQKRPNCRFSDCINLYRCGQNGRENLTVFVYPVQQFLGLDENGNKYPAHISREYYKILETVVHSRYYTPNPNEACLFLPSIDLLHQELLDTEVAERALSSLQFWEDGQNHIIFNMFPGTFPHYNRIIDVNTAKAIILGSGFDVKSYRTDFDISIPAWSPLMPPKPITIANYAQRRFLLIIAQMNILPKYHDTLYAMSHARPADVLFLRNCSSQLVTSEVRCNLQGTRYKYPDVLLRGKFCLLMRSVRLSQPDLLEMLAFNCIPVVLMDNVVLPFSEIIDWSTAIVQIREADSNSILDRLARIPPAKIDDMQKHGWSIYLQYFKNIETITLNALQILESRIFTHNAQAATNSRNIYSYGSRNPLFAPFISPRTQGFTAVILTYDRLESLFKLIQNLSDVPSLQSILIIWNNQHKAPPHSSVYPLISKPVKIIQTRANKLSNRFYPYAEIETEAILSIDDDIIMLTADEVDFGFEVWREFPDRIVGFPSRIHVWDNETCHWRYESEWTNQISMVLTGAAFHHKYWSHMYTYSMPGDIKDWVDKHMNCEDIAMNFLVANITRQAPIKITPRKKFKCPECTNNEMISAYLDHMLERSACIDRFYKEYGHMPLRNVEFRADPVLFKDKFPEKLKRFNDIGNL